MSCVSCTCSTIRPEPAIRFCGLGFGFGVDSGMFPLVPLKGIIEPLNPKP